MIGWEDDNNTVGPIAAPAKQSLLRLIPHILPTETDHRPLYYRLVLEHGDFGIHNMSIAIDADGQSRVTSLFDWETGCVVPALLADPLMAVAINLSTDSDANPSVSQLPDEATTTNHAEYMRWAEQYCEELFKQAPDFKRAIRAGKDARHLWFALRDWRGQDPEGYFGDLGAWAERRMKELGVDGKVA